MRAPCDEAQVRSRSEAVPCTAATRPWILAATILGSSLAFIDGTVVNVALPVLQTTFHATVVDVQWVVESYGLFLSALILAGGALGDLFRRRRVFLIGVGIFAGMLESSKSGWGNPLVSGGLAGGVVCFVLFLRVEMKAPAPMVPLELFKSRSFLGANVLTLFLYAAIGVFFFLFPMNLIRVERYSTTAAGAAALPMILLMFLLSRWSGGLVNRYGARIPLIVGPLGVAAGFIMFAAIPAGNSYWKTFFPAFLVLGFGMAVTVAPLTTVVMSSAGEAHFGAASGVNNAVARVAGVLAIAVFGIVMMKAFSSHLEQSLRNLQIPQNIVQDLRSKEIDLASLELPPGLDENTVAAIQQAISESFRSGYRLVLLSCAGLAAASTLVAWKLIASEEEIRKKP